MTLRFGLNLYRITWIELTGYQVKLNLTDFSKSKMPTWDEICQVLEELQMLILEIQSDLADPATEQERRPGLQQPVLLHGRKLWKSMETDPDVVR